MMILSVTAIVLPTVDQLNFCVSVIGCLMNLIVTVLVSMKLGLQRIQTRDSTSVRLKASGQSGSHKSEGLRLTLPRKSLALALPKQIESIHSCQEETMKIQVGSINSRASFQK
ncbi:hypothetical protein BC830DRAFT_1125211 [Chytriomyces sp. MP71]|nr:hypothetical protein BC830DRAFT_1125211 [Chytriomyces sp. MP71]